MSHLLPPLPSYSEATAHPPPSYVDAIHTQDILSTDGYMSVVDFKPIKGDQFGNLIERANVWLAKHCDMEACRCESVKFWSHNGTDFDLDCQRTTFSQATTTDMCNLVVLRLWVKPKLSGNRRFTQQLAHFCIIPNEIPHSSKKFEDLEMVKHRLNNRLSATWLEGRVISVEVFELPFCHMLVFDSEVVCYKLPVEDKKKFLKVLRVFYERGPQSFEEAEYVDFVPRPIRSISSSSCYETFEALCHRTNDWIHSHLTPSNRLINLQTVQYKLSSLKALNFRDNQLVKSGKMSHSEYFNDSTYFLTVLRLWYAHPHVPSPFMTRLPKLSVKTFVPTSFSIPEFDDPQQYETLDQLKFRMMQWLQVTKASIISVETVPIRMYLNGLQKCERSQATITSRNLGKNECWMFIIRLYINGTIVEPNGNAMSGSAGGFGIPQEFLDESVFDQLSLATDKHHCSLQ